jgi:hypothetical protein
MPRKLKTFQTSLGFYDLAIAAPSMKAAFIQPAMAALAFEREQRRRREEAAREQASARVQAAWKRVKGSNIRG